MRRVVIIVCAGLLLLPAAVKNRMSQDIPAHTVFSVIPGGRMLVKVGGNVRYPGIYEVPVNVLAVDAIKMAMPLRPCTVGTGDPSAVQPLQNGSAVMFTVQSDGFKSLVVGQMTVPERMAMGIPLDISTMKGDDFDRLPGIGPALAERIIAYRQKNGGILRVSDLCGIEGIGEKKYKLIKSYF